MEDTLKVRGIFDIGSFEKGSRVMRSYFINWGQSAQKTSQVLKTAFTDYAMYAKYYAKYPKDGLRDMYSYAVDKFKKMKELYASVFKKPVQKSDKEAPGSVPKESGGGFGALAVAKGMALYNAGVGILQRGLGAISQQMPFLSQSFEMAGTIFAANLVYPLAKELMPLVKEFFGWIQKNRINFVSIGTLLVSGFRIVKSVVTGAFSLIKTLWTSMMDTIGGAKLTFSGFINYMNFLMLKVVFLFTFIQILLEPIFKGIGISVGWLWNNVVSPFLTGFRQGFTEHLIPVLSEFGMLVKEVQDAFKLLQESGDFSWIGEAFKFIGKVIGYSVLVPIRLFIAQVRLIARLFTNPKKALVDYGNTMYEIFANNPVFKLFSGMVNSAIEGIKTKFNNFKNFLGGIWDSALARFGAFIDKIKNHPAIAALTSMIQALADPKNLAKKIATSGLNALGLDGFATGGDVRSGKPIVVGENGPEVFTPGQNGHITPNEQLKPRISPMGMSSGNNVTVQDNSTYHFNIQSTDPKGVAREVQQITKEKKESGAKQGFVGSRIAFT